MRFLLATLLTATLAFIAGLYLPWWSIAFIAFLVALLIKQRIGRAFLSGFTAIFLLWGLLALLLHLPNNGVLAGRVARVFPLNENAIALVFITAVIGALVGGFAAMSGSSLRPLERGRRVP